MLSIDLRVEKWKKRLLDLGKRNRLINYRETKRSNLKITFPGIDMLYSRLVSKEELLSFPYMDVDTEDETNESAGYITKYGDLRTNQTIKEQQKTLLSLRNKAKTAIEEQGVNILYLSFGFLEWNESGDLDRNLVSPIILIPVSLKWEAITAPFMLGLHEDEIVVNPTLAYKLENDFGITLPDLDDYENDIHGFLKTIGKLVLQNGWDVLYEADLGLLSFLKINMYKDLENNTGKITGHPIIKALTGDPSEIPSLPQEYVQFDHDHQSRPIDTYQVVDADSSQQDAILYSKKGVSFVLQGPPGTGKSQTITNIIAEALADGKKVLFVSEKMAALEVVHKRLSEAGLADFCLTLHSHKANKKEVLDNLGRTLNMNRFRVQSEALDQLETLKINRDRLNQYNIELHTSVSPLGVTIYEMNGRLAKLPTTPDIVFSIGDVRQTTAEKLNQYQYRLREFSNTLGKMHEDYAVNPWRGCRVPVLSHELRHDIETYLRTLTAKLKDLVDTIEQTNLDFGVQWKTSLHSIDDIFTILETVSRSPKIPLEWIQNPDISNLLEQAETYSKLKTEYQAIFYNLMRNQQEGYFALPAALILERFNELIRSARKIINVVTYPSDTDIADHLENFLGDFQQFMEGFEVTQQVCGEAVGLLGVKPIGTLADALLITDLFENLLGNPKPAQDWFDAERFKVVKRLFNDARKTFENLDADTKALLSRFDSEILNLDYSTILKRFKADYTSPIKFIKRGYWADKKTIRSLSNEVGKKFTDAEIIQVLNDLKNITEKKTWIAENDALMISLLGSNYAKGYTDWPAFDTALQTFEKILTYFGSGGIPQQTKQILLADHARISEVEMHHATIKAVWDADLINRLNQNLALSKSAEFVNFHSFWNGLKAAKSALAELSNEYAKMRQFQ